jgi:hypothetical protein
MSSSKREANGKVVWEGGRDGAQAVESERITPNFRDWEFIGVCR